MLYEELHIVSQYPSPLEIDRQWDSLLASRKSYIEDFVTVYESALVHFRGHSRVAELWPEHVHALVSCGQVGKFDRGICQLFLALDVRSWCVGFRGVHPAPRCKPFHVGFTRHYGYDYDFHLMGQIYADY